MRFPAFLRSVRFRLAITYSLIVFGLAFIVVAGVNYALSRTLDDQPIARQVRFTTLIRPDGSTVTVAEEVIGRMVSIEQAVNERALENLRRYSVWALLGLFPVSIGAGWLVADRALRPIGRITGVAREIQSTDLSRRIELGGPDDELKQLADTFDAMLDRVEAGVDAQRTFIQDTSHELRNPLAVMATNLDVVLADPAASAAELRRTSEVVRRTVERATRTVDDLVLYARSEIPEVQRGPVPLRQLLDEVLEEYRGPIERAGLAVDRVGDEDEVVVPADRAALKRAVGNLVNNAVRLTRPGSTLQVGSGRWKGFGWLGVDDQGPGIDPRHHGAVFQRLWSGDDSSLRAERRSGLGLAIVRQIAQAHGGQVTVRSVRGGGAAFVIWVPLEAGADPAVVSDDGIHPVHDPFAAAQH